LIGDQLAHLSFHYVTPTKATSTVMRGLDPRICRWHEMAGSSPAMTDVWRAGIRTIEDENPT
jgi:hypothetical protein